MPGRVLPERVCQAGGTAGAKVRRAGRISRHLPEVHVLGWKREGEVPMRAVGLRGMTASPEVISVPPLPLTGSVTLGKSLSFLESQSLHLKHEALELTELKELLSSPGLFTFIEVTLPF